MGNHGPEWADNWKGNSMATFGTPGEDIAKIGYVGDYGL